MFRAHSGGAEELDQTQFEAAVRSSCGLGRDAFSDIELRQLFNMVDTDGNGRLSGAELDQLLAVSVSAHSAERFCAFLRVSALS